MRLSLVALMLAGPALAEAPMTAAEFQAYIGTDTLTYGYSDGAIGTADYGPDQTLLWQYEGQETCFEGTWHQSGDQLCFLSEIPDYSACWHFTLTAGGLHGFGAGPIEGVRIFEISRTEEPLSCAPELGV